MVLPAWDQENGAAHSDSLLDRDWCDRRKSPSELASSFAPRGTSSARADLVDLLLRRSPHSGCQVDLPYPAEIGAVAPHPMHDDREPSCQRHDRSSLAAALCDLHGPGFQPGPFRHPRQEHLRRFIEEAAHHPCRCDCFPRTGAGSASDPRPDRWTWRCGSERGRRSWRRRQA